MIIMHIVLLLTFFFANGNFMDKYQKYLKYNVRVPKWILDNKSITITKEIVKEVKCSFITINNNVNINVPCILFIDDVTTLTNKKNILLKQEQIINVNTLLIEMNGFKKNTGIIIIPQTNFVKQNSMKNVNVELSDKEVREIILCINVCNENLIIFYIHANNLYIGVYFYHNL